MDFGLLRAFVEVVEAGTMADAADALGCTAPAVSQKMARLERDLGVRLLERTPHGVVPTPAGSALLERAWHVMGVTSDLRKAVLEAAGASKNRLRLSAFSSASVNLLPDAVTLVKRQFPEVGLHLVEGDFEAPYLPVLRGDVDLSIAVEFDHVPLKAPEGLDVTTLGRDPYRVVLALNHPLATKRDLKLADLRDEHWVYFPPSNVARRCVEAETARHDFAPKVTFEARDYQVIHVLVGAGLGVALLPELTIPEFDQTKIAVRILRNSHLGRTVRLAHREGAPSGPLLAMKQALAEVFATRMAGVLAH